jgi:Ca2+-transporting ATPase
MAERFYNQSVSELLSDLKTDSSKGLSLFETQERRKQFGFNQLAEKKGRSVWSMFFSQFSDAVIWILIAAAVISAVIGDALEAGVILVLVLLNALLGTRQEFKAEKAMDALKKLSAPQATVIREGIQQRVPASELVPGDLVLLEGGDRVPADIRLVESINLRVSEAALTGESNPVSKTIDPLKGEIPLAEQQNMVFMNTGVSFGRGKGIVTATGMQTEFGKIAGLLQGIEQEKTPLAKKMGELGSFLSRLVIGIAAVIFVVELLLELWNVHFFLASVPFSLVINLLLVAVALAVAAVPEGLPAVTTITLSSGMQQMARNNAIIRKMAAVETLGSTSVICCDKTGTLTKNEMTVKSVWLEKELFEITGSGYGAQGEIRFGNSTVSPDSKEWELLAQNCWLCNNARFDSKNQQWMGDPTEISLAVLAQKTGFEREKVLRDFSFENELPFESERKRMSVVYRHQKKFLVFCKGSCESVLSVCSSALENGKTVSLSATKRKEILQHNDSLAGNGMRVLGFAFRESNSLPSEIEKELVFIGLVGMMDAPREGVSEAVLECQSAGIEVKMITGDHPLTAKAVAQEIGLLYSNHDTVVTGTELTQWSEKELEEKIDSLAVIARASAQDKMRVIAALQKKGKVIAMTGDGINDAPALKKADIGVAMGITGTDVSKEASAMVIQDDHFATIVKAVKEGRRVYDNIKSFVQYLLSANAAEVLVIFFGILVWGITSVPLLPFHLLWINLLTDGLPALALGNEKADRHVMQRKPRPPGERITDNLLRPIITAGIVGLLVTLTAFSIGFSEGIEKARTLAFATLVLFELVWVFECKNPNRTVFNSNPFDNRSLNLAVLLSLVLLVLAVHFPFFNVLLQTVPLSLGEWLLVAVLSLPALFVEEAYTRFSKKRKTGNAEQLAGFS